MKKIFFFDTETLKYTLKTQVCCARFGLLEINFFDTVHDKKCQEFNKRIEKKIADEKCRRVCLRLKEMGVNFNSSNIIEVKNKLYESYNIPLNEDYFTDEVTEIIIE